MLDQETKLQSYMSFPFTMLCLGMKVDNKTQWIHVNYSASSLYSLMADNEFRQTNIGRQAWMSLIKNSSLQEYCHQEGFNVKGMDGYGTMARIGILGKSF